MTERAHAFQGRQTAAMRSTAFVRQPVQQEQQPATASAAGAAAQPTFAAPLPPTASSAKPAAATQPQTPLDAEIRAKVVRFWLDSLEGRPTAQASSKPLSRKDKAELLALIASEDKTVSDAHMLKAIKMIQEHIHMSGKQFGDKKDIRACASCGTVITPSIYGRTKRKPGTERLSVTSNTVRSGTTLVEAVLGKLRTGKYLDEIYSERSSSSEAPLYLGLYKDLVDAQGMFDACGDCWVALKPSSKEAKEKAKEAEAAKAAAAAGAASSSTNSAAASDAASAAAAAAAASRADTTVIDGAAEQAKNQTSSSSGKERS